MKIAVIGSGKTGGEVVKLLSDDQLVGPFDTQNKPTAEKLRAADAAIIFVPGTAVDAVLDVVMEAGIAAAWGSTGYDWRVEQLDMTLAERGMKWMRASNFSLGMNIMRRCLHLIGRGSEMLDDPEFAIHEVHHTGKKDAPSGTALSWEKWLGKQADITSERKGDIKGIHTLSLKTKVESMQLTHKALDRAVFARGALWAVHQLMDDTLNPGFYSMETLFDHKVD